MLVLAPEEETGHVGGQDRLTGGVQARGRGRGVLAEGRDWPDEGTRA